MNEKFGYYDSDERGADSFHPFSSVPTFYSCQGIYWNMGTDGSTFNNSVTLPKGKYLIVVMNTSVNDYSKADVTFTNVTETYGIQRVGYSNTALATNCAIADLSEETTITITTTYSNAGGIVVFSL